MSKQIYLHIPEPCHEDWTKMTPAQQGRFCQSCSKTVVDFSLMSDKEIIAYLSKAAGSTCGRFTDKQLERPMVKEIPFYLQPHKMAVSALLPAFILAGTGSLHAQGKVMPVIAKTPALQKVKAAKPPQSIDYRKIAGVVRDENKNAVSGAAVTIKESTKGTVTNEKGEFQISFPRDAEQVILEVKCVGYITKEIDLAEDEIKDMQVTVEMQSMLTGEVVVVGAYYSDDWLPAAPRLKKEVTGRVVNDLGEPVSFASVKMGAGKGVVADSNGLFSIKVRPGKSRLKLTVSSAGYEAAEMLFTLSEFKNDSLNIALKQKQLDAVEVVSYCTKRLTGLLGGISVVRTVTRIDTAKTFIQKLFNNEMFKAYPNPATAGQSIQLTFKKPGLYSIQLFDNAGKLYLAKEFTVKGTKETLPLPASISKGIYYLKAVNNDTKKQFIDKILIQ